MITHSSILAWGIPWTEEPSRLVYGVIKSRTRLSDYHFLTEGVSAKNLEGYKENHFSTPTT